MGQKKQEELVTQTVYAVEKFTPTHCPSCRNPFTRNSQDGYLLWTYWLHDTVENSRAIVKSIHFPGLATDLIACGKCQNVTVRIMHARRIYEKKPDAEKAIAHEGFVNLATTYRRAKVRLRGFEQTLYFDAPFIEITEIRIKPRRKRR